MGVGSLQVLARGGVSTCSRTTTDLVRLVTQTHH